jgi:hypothetical protein
MLCSEFDYLIYGVFLDLIIKLTIYQKNETIAMESCQFRKGRSYLIDIRGKEKFRSSRSLKLHLEEIKLLKEMGMKADFLFEIFQVIMNIENKLGRNLLEKVYDLKNCLIVCCKLEGVLVLNGRRKMLKMGINRIEKNNGQLQGRKIIIYVKIYETVVEVGVDENTSWSIFII